MQLEIERERERERVVSFPARDQTFNLFSLLFFFNYICNSTNQNHFFLLRFRSNLLREYSIYTRKASIGARVTPVKVGKTNDDPIWLNAEDRKRDEIFSARRARRHCGFPFIAVPPSTKNHREIGERGGEPPLGHASRKIGPKINLPTDAKIHRRESMRGLPHLSTHFFFVFFFFFFFFVFVLFFLCSRP